MEENNNNTFSVLAPTDFTPKGTNAILQAIEIARVQNGTVHALHIVEKETEVETALQKLTQELDALSYDLLIGHVVVGEIYNSINDVALKQHVDLIVMGTHGKKNIQLLLGSNALKVIDSTNIPFIIVQDNVKNTFKNILFPVSLHDEDRQKVAEAIKLAKAFDATIHIFPRFESNKTSEKQMINTILQIKKYFTNHSVKFEVAPLLTTSDNFQKKILAYSQEIKADIILIVTNPSNHLPLIPAKEETLLFNELQIPIMSITDKKLKSVRFSTSG